MAPTRACARVLVAGVLVLAAGCGRADPSTESTMTPLPSPTSSATPSPSPTTSPTPSPDPAPTAEPTAIATPSPSTSSSTAAATDEPTDEPTDDPTDHPTSGDAEPTFPPIDDAVPVHGGKAIVVVLAATEVGDDVDTSAFTPFLDDRLAIHDYGRWAGWSSVGCSDGAADLLAAAGDEREIDLVHAGYFSDRADAEQFRTAWDYHYPHEPVLAIGPVTTYCLD